MRSRIAKYVQQSHPQTLTESAEHPPPGLLPVRSHIYMVPFRGGKTQRRLPHKTFLDSSLGSSAVVCVQVAWPGSGLRSVGAGRDGFLQLYLQRRRRDQQVAETQPAHAAGFKQLLARHRNLLIATAGTEHIPTIPAVAEEDRTQRD